MSYANLCASPAAGFWLEPLGRAFEWPFERPFGRQGALQTQIRQCPTQIFARRLRLLAFFCGGFPAPANAPPVAGGGQWCPARRGAATGIGRLIGPLIGGLIGDSSSRLIGGLNGRLNGRFNCP